MTSAASHLGKSDASFSPAEFDKLQLPCGDIKPPDTTFDGGPPVLGRIGNLETRLARNIDEVQAAQALRYQVFYQEMGALAGAEIHRHERDEDSFDPICDHLVVIDRDQTSPQCRHGRIVATYRMLRQEIANRNSGFYSAGEFDITPMLSRHPSFRFLEVGRSCVLPAYRSKRTLELMWHGLWAFVVQNKYDVMFGCASLPDTKTEDLVLPLSFLRQFAPATAEWQVFAGPGKAAPLRLIIKDQIDPRAALRTLPPLIKGYLRLGAHFGHDAVIDRQFGTTDVLVIMPVKNLNTRYLSHYGKDASRMAV